jgi:hypothetical protein
MALTDDGGMNTTMLVSPNGYAGGNNGGFFGGDFAWVLLVLILGGGWGGFGGFGMGGMMGAGMMGGMFGMDYLYPWLNNSEHISDGFRDQQLSNQVSGIQNAITSGFGDVQTALCGGFAGVNQNVSQGFANTNLGMCQGFNGVNTAISGAQNALAQQMYTNQIADLERSYAAQTANTAGLTNVSAQLANCCCENRAATADLKYTVATEECATRNASAMNTRDIIDSQTRGTQAILDKLCALELDGVKGQLAQAQRENVALQNAVNMATMQASQTAQTAQILAGQAAEIDGVYNRLKNCPVPTTPVYGNQPIFSCAQNFAAGCGCCA